MTKEETLKAIEVMQAYYDDKQIECCAIGENCWCEIDWVTFDWSSFNYRVKPKPKLRPYKDAEEFLKAQKEHGPLLFGGIANHYVSIKEISNKRVWLQEEDCSWDELCGKYKWQDGTPCEVKEE